MSDPRNTGLAAIDAALDDDPIEPDEARAAVRDLGIDVAKMAARVRARVSAADERDRRARFDDARRAYATEVERLAAREREPERPRGEQIAVLQALLARAGSREVSMHFHKYDEATDDELAEMIRALRHLLEGDEP